MKPRSCREKGRKFEFWTRKAISELMDIPLDSVLVRSKSAAGVDIWVSPEYRKLFPFGVECKNRNKLSFWKVVNQTSMNASREDLFPMIVAKRGRDIWVSVPLEVFFAILLQLPLSESTIKALKERLPKMKDARFGKED